MKIGVTNAHVILDADEIDVIFSNGIVLSAELLGKDTKTDLAVLKINPEPEQDLLALEFGDSDNLKVGEWVMAIGKPPSLPQALHRVARRRTLLSTASRTFGPLDPLVDGHKLHVPLAPRKRSLELVELLGDASTLARESKIANVELLPEDDVRKHLRRYRVVAHHPVSHLLVNARTDTAVE